MIKEVIDPEIENSQQKKNLASNEEIPESKIP